MIKRVFVDTDVILDLLLAREPFFPAATRLFLLIQEERIKGFVSPLIFSNLFYILRKQLSVSDAIAALRKLKLLTNVLPVDDRTIDLALASSFKDFEDAVQYYTALSHDMDAIVTRNKKDFKASQLPLFTAEECVEIFLSSH